MIGTNPTSYSPLGRPTLRARVMLALVMAFFVGSYAHGADIYASNANAEADGGTILKAFLGISSNGNLQEALDSALADADAFYLALPFISDQFYDYVITETSGSRLGIAGVNTVRVRILTRGCCEVAPGG